MQQLSEHNILIFLVQIFLLLGFARILGQVFVRFKQPSLTAEILVGICLGPTLFGRLLPELHAAIFPADAIQLSMLETVAWLGVLFLLLEAGLHIDFSTVWRQKDEALKIALTGVFVPIVIGFLLCLLLPARYLVDPNQRIIFSLFMATAMAITAMPIVTRILHDINIQKTDLGFLIMIALSMNDIIGWLIFTVVIGLFTYGSFEIARIAFVFLATAGFLVFCLSIGRIAVSKAIDKIKTQQLPEPSTSLTFICLLGLLCGAITQKIGIHALFGFFVAGLMAGQAKALSERTRQVISQMVFAIFVPLFFASIGLRLDFIRNFDLGIVVFVTMIGILGKFIGAWLGVNLTRLSREDRYPIAIAHTPGGTMEIVVGTLALEYHLISNAVFEAIVFGAIVSSAIAGPWISYALKRRKKISIFEFFAKGAIADHLASGERDGVILELCEIAYDQYNIPAIEGVYKAVLDRENAMGTAIEEGIAFPHARIASIRRPIIVFGRSESGVEWNSPDGKSARNIFLILTPKDDTQAQVQILGLIAKAMSDVEIRQAIMAASDKAEIWQVLQKTLTEKHIERK